MATYIHAFGVNNALGSHAEQVLQQFQGNQSLGMRPYLDLFSGRPTQVARVLAELPAVPEHLLGFDCRNIQLLLHAYAQIQEQVEAAKSRYGSDRIAVVLGSTTAGTERGEYFRRLAGQLYDLGPDYHYRIEEVHSAVDFLQAHAGLTGLSFSVSTACTSSGKALLQAQRLLQSGLCDAVVVGGVDSLCEMTLNGFDALESLEPGLTRPLSRNRQGINIGEGAALMLVSREPSSVALLGMGESSDAYHISSPQPEGLGAIEAMQQALTASGLQAADIGYLNLHGTGTPKNDAMETQAVLAVLGQVPVSSTKALIGHTLGAASIQELGLCYLLLSAPRGSVQVPKHLFDDQLDPELAPVNLIREPLLVNFDYMMSNSFAFGGSNFSAVIGRTEA